MATLSCSALPLCRLELGAARRVRTMVVMRAASENVADAMGRARVLNLSGQSVALTDLWADRTAVVGFARHFGCLLCRKRADMLALNKATMDAAGVALVLIGPGNADQAQAFVEQTKFPGEVYADPEHAAFHAMNFVSGVATILNPKAGMKMVGALAEGYRQDWGLSFQKHTVQKGGWQQGGILVAGPGRERILYLHRDKEAGDEPDMKDVIVACCSSADDNL